MSIELGSVRALFCSERSPSKINRVRILPWRPLGLLTQGPVRISVLTGPTIDPTFVHDEILRTTTDTSGARTIRTLHGSGRAPSRINSVRIPPWQPHGLLIQGPVRTGALTGPTIDPRFVHDEILRTADIPGTRTIRTRFRTRLGLVVGIRMWVVGDHRCSGVRAVVASTRTRIGHSVVSRRNFDASRKRPRDSGARLSWLIAAA